MLSTSKKTRFQYQYLLIAVVLLAMVSVIALYQSGVLPTVSVGQASAAVDLSWPARPDFSSITDKAMIPVTASSEGLAVYQPGREADAARYTAAAESFAAKEAASIQRSREADAARYTAMAKLYAAQSDSIQYGPPGR